MQDGSLASPSIQRQPFAGGVAHAFMFDDLVLHRDRLEDTWRDWK